MWKNVQTRCLNYSAYPFKDFNSKFTHNKKLTGYVELKMLKNNLRYNFNYLLKNLFKLLVNPEFLRFSYSSLLVDKYTHKVNLLEKFFIVLNNFRYFESLSIEIDSYISKNILSGRPNFRCLKFPTDAFHLTTSIFIKNNILQFSIITILEVIFTPLISISLYSFKSIKGVHNTLFKAKCLFVNVNWFLESDLYTYFRFFPSYFILDEIKNKIDDDIFLFFIFSKNKLEFLTKNSNLSIIIDSLVDILIFYTLDNWLFDYSLKINSFFKNTKLFSLKFGFVLNDTLFKNRTLNFPSITYTKMQSYLLFISYKFNNMKFIRHKSNLIVGLLGSYSSCFKIKNDLISFLQKRIFVNCFNIVIRVSNSFDNKISYLNFDLFLVSHTNLFNLKTTLSFTHNPYILQIVAPISKIIKSFSFLGYFFNKNSNVPIKICKLLDFSLHFIINHFIYLGTRLLIYYSCSDNFTSLKSSILVILKRLCALTFAYKLNFRTIKDVFIKFSFDLIILKTSNNLIVSQFNTNTFTNFKKKFNSNILDMNPFLFLDFISLYCPRSKFFSNDCFSCHSFDFFLTNTNTYLYKQNTLTIKITRKSGILNRLSQHLIFLCKFCHRKIYDNIYFGPVL